MKANILVQIENYVFEYFKNNAPAENVYHNISHVQFVVDMVKEISDNANVSENDLEILQIAAWFHDLGHIKTWEGHEEISASLAEKYLKNISYPQESIDKVIGCILATKIPHKPNSPLEEIICDADIAHIGSKDFFNLSNLLKLEIENRKDKKLTDTEWMNKNIEFLTKSKFFTKYAKKTFEENKNANLLKLQKRYKKKIEKKKLAKAKNEKLAVEKEKLAKKSATSKKADRGIETMFRNIMRTHVSFSSMADSKANIMISVNTLLLGAVFTILARKLDTNPHLIIPTIVLTIVSLVTLVMAVRVTRPTIS